MRKKKIFLVAMIAVLLCIFTLRLPVFADVGDFETYSYDSDSSWDSSDSYTYSSHDYSSSSSSGSGSPVVGLIIIGVIIVIIVLAARSNKNGDGGQGTVTTTNRVVDRSTDVYKNQDEIVDKVKAIDPDFSSEVFKSWAGDLFRRAKVFFRQCCGSGAPGRGNAFMRRQGVTVPRHTGDEEVLKGKWIR